MAYTSFIDTTYFTGEIQIPTLPSSDTSLTQAISQYEKEILIQLLGYKLYTLLIADCAGITGLPVTTKYVNLVNGAEFTHPVTEETLKWEGLRNTAKQSLISYYIFYKYVERDVTRLYGSGISIATPGTGWERVSPVNKLCNAWERMRSLYGIIPLDYKGTKPMLADDIPSTFDYTPSAYNFLYTNIADYPDWVFTPQWNINQFGI